MVKPALCDHFRTELNAQIGNNALDVMSDVVHDALWAIFSQMYQLADILILELAEEQSRADLFKRLGAKARRFFWMRCTAFRHYSFSGSD